MNIEREFPLHVAIWNNDTEKLTELIQENKVSSLLEKTNIFMIEDHFFVFIVHNDEYFKKMIKRIRIVLFLFI